MQGQLTNVTTQHATLVVNADKATVVAEFDKYYTSALMNVPKSIQEQAKVGGYRKPNRDKVINLLGGPKTFYLPAVADLLTQHLIDNNHSDILTFNDVSFKETPDEYQLEAKVFFLPEVKWKATVPGINAPFHVEVLKREEGYLTKVIMNEIDVLREKSVVLQPKAGSIADGDVVVLSCTSTLDGVQWGPGSFKSNKWLVSKDIIKTPEMYEAVLGKNSGDVFTVDAVLNDKFLENVRGKTVTASISIESVLERKLPNLDDDFAVSNGFDTYDNLKVSITEECTQKLENHRRNLILANITAQLVRPDVVEVSQIPGNWVNSKAAEIFNESLGVYGDEAMLIKAFAGQKTFADEAVKDKPTLLQYFAGKCVQQLITDLVITAWGREKNIEGYSGVESISNYARVVEQEMLNCCEVKEVDGYTT